jgi:hypothetical protein
MNAVEGREANTGKRAGNYGVCKVKLAIVIGVVVIVFALYF